VRALRNYGSGRHTHELAGMNSRLDEVQAAILRVRLRRLEEAVAHRRLLADVYRRGLQALPLVLPFASAPESHAWHLFVVQTARRDQLQAFLAQHSIETMVHYPRAVYRLPPLLEFAPTNWSVSDELAATVLSLPIGSHVSVEDAGRVCERVSEFFRRNQPGAG
jgi:dTDP-3-amino-3,4,6-trideoxy-alpha-D-glucose transaminase